MHDVKNLFCVTEKCGARPWMWADREWYSKESEKQFLKHMSKEVMLSNWYYGNWQHTNDFFADSMMAYGILEEHGFEQFPTGGNCNSVVEYCHDNMRLTVENCSKIISPENLSGFMMTTWVKTIRENFPSIEEAVTAMSNGYGNISKIHQPVEQAVKI